MDTQTEFQDVQSIILALTELGTTQTEMAEESGLTQGRISQIKIHGGTCQFEEGKKLESLLQKKQNDPEAAA